MKFKGTVVLAAVAVAMGLYVYLVEFKKAAKDEEQKAQDEKVLAFEPSKVKAFEIKNSKGEFKLEKDKESWKIVSPIQDLADQSSVTSTLNDLAEEKFEQSIDEGNLKEFGLETPTDTLTLTFQDGSKKKINVGADGALMGKVYLQRDGEKKVLYGNAGYKSQVEKTIKDLRDKRVYRGNKDDIQHIELSVNTKDVKGHVSLSKSDGAWKIDGRDEKADPEAVTAVLNGIDGLKATDFAGENGKDAAASKKYGLDKPAVELALKGKDGADLGKIVLSDAKANNQIFAVNGTLETVFQLYTGVNQAFMKKPDDFRDKKLPLDFKKDDVAELLVKNSLAEVHLTKKGNSWELPLPDTTKEVSQIQVANLLDKMSSLKVAEYIDREKPVGLSEPVGHVILKNSKGDELLDFAWGERAKDKRNYYAKSNLYKGNFTVEGTSLEGVPVQTLVETKAPKDAKTAPATSTVPGH